ncbi:hypothetical protein BC943DRAFT_339772 [Umbelopsis sp. AD052]|nr:hypothetical protein BC943DRAFT_339772 [Umbelopsis sp. AD052]
MDGNNSKSHNSDNTIPKPDRMLSNQVSTSTASIGKEQLPIQQLTQPHARPSGQAVPARDTKANIHHGAEESRKKKNKKNKGKAGDLDIQTDRKCRINIDQPAKIRMSRPHAHPHPDSMDSSAAKDFDDFDALLRAHEQPINTTPVRDSHKERIPNAPHQDENDGNIEDVAAKILGRRPKPKNDRQKQKRKHNSAEGGRSETNGPRKKQAVEKTPFVPRVVCKFWEGGYCSNGDKCTFLHAGEQKVVVSNKADPKNVLCRHFVTGSCRKGDQCPFSHNTKLEACRHFHVKGICLTGEDCPFAHEDATAESLAAMRNKNTPCRFYHLKGFCTSGDDCLYSHQNQSDDRLTQLKGSETCKYFLSGNCLAGDECLFSHDVNSTTAPAVPEYTKATSVPQPTMANFELKLE